MKLTRYLFLIPLLAFTAADTWQPFALDKHLTVQLPVMPTELKEDMGLPADTHIFVARTGSDIYQLIGPIPISADINVEDAKMRQQYYDGLVGGMVTDEGNTLLSRASFPTSVGEGVTVSYRALATETSKEMVLFNRSFIVQHNSYSLTFFRTNGDTTTSTTRRRFFNSITVKP